MQRLYGWNKQINTITQTFKASFYEFWWVTLVPSNAESTSSATYTGPKISMCESTKLFTSLCSFTQEKSWPQVTFNTNVLPVSQAGNTLSCFTWPSEIVKSFYVAFIHTFSALSFIMILKLLEYFTCFVEALWPLTLLFFQLIICKVCDSTSLSPVLMLSNFR